MSIAPFISYPSLKEDARRSIGNRVSALAQTDASTATTYPSPLKADVAVLPEQTVVALYELILRADPSNWQAEVTVSGTIAAGAYTVTLAGTGYTYTATGTEDVTTILTELKDEIDSSAPANTYITEVVEGARLVISNGSAAPDVRAAFTATVTSNLAVATDATSVEFEVWIRRGTGSDARWSRVLSGQSVEENTTNRLDIAGYADAMDIRITSTDGRVRRTALPGVVGD